MWIIDLFVNYINFIELNQYITIANTRLKLISKKYLWDFIANMCMEVLNIKYKRKLTTYIFNMGRTKSCCYVLLFQFILLHQRNFMYLISGAKHLQNEKKKLKKYIGWEYFTRYHNAFTKINCKDQSVWEFAAGWLCHVWYDVFATKYSFRYKMIVLWVKKTRINLTVCFVIMKSLP